MVEQNELQSEEVSFEVDAEYKEEFLEKQLKSTRSFYSYVLKKADEFEVQLGLKIYDFSTDDRDELLKVQYKNKNVWAFQTVLSPLRTYVDFCIGKSLVRHNQNRFSTILPADYNQYTNDQAKENSYITQSENREFQKGLINYQDKLIIELLGLGVRGRTEKGNTLEELINLKVSDINYEEKQIYLTSNDGELRYLEVDDYTLDLIKKTIDRGFYLFGNGLKGKPNEDGVYEKTDKGFIINETEYVFRTPGKKKFGKTDYQLFANRVQRIQGWLQKPYLTVSNLYFSSIISWAKKLKEEKGEPLTREDYIRINEKFRFGGSVSENPKAGEKYVYKTREIVESYLDKE